MIAGDIKSDFFLPHSSFLLPVVKMYLSQKCPCPVFSWIGSPASGLNYSIYERWKKAYPFQYPEWEDIKQLTYLLEILLLTNFTILKVESRTMNYCL